MSRLTGQIADGFISLLLILTAAPGLFAQEQAPLRLYRIDSSGQEPYYNRILVTPTHF
jgi:hypothetical protein